VFWGAGGGGRYFAKFQPEKYDLDPYKGFSMEKVDQIHQISKKISPERQIFMISSSR
jgi:hypothetical protein